MTFSINTAPVSARGGPAPLVSFYLPGQGEALDRQTDPDAECTPWVEAMAEAAANGKGCSFPASFEACLRLPYLTGALPIDLYEKLYVLQMQLEDGCRDLDALRSLWMVLREQERVDHSALVQAAEALYPDAGSRLAALEREIREDIERREKREAALRAKKAAARERIAELQACITQSKADNNELFSSVTRDQLRKEDLREQIAAKEAEIGSTKIECEALVEKIQEMKAQIEKDVNDRFAKQDYEKQQADALERSYLWNDDKPFESALRYKELLTEHLAQERQICPSAAVILHRFTTDYPSRSYVKKNAKVEVRRRGADEIQSAALHKNVTEEERIHHGIIALLKIFKKILNDALGRQTVQYVYSKGGSFRLESCEAIFPMLALIELYRKKELPLQMREKIARQKGTDLQESMLYYAMILLSLMLGTDDTLLPPKKMQRFVQDSGIVDLIGAIVALFPDPSRGKQLVGLETELFFECYKSYPILKKELVK